MNKVSDIKSQPSQYVCGDRFHSPHYLKQNDSSVCPSYVNLWSGSILPTGWCYSCLECHSFYCILSIKLNLISSHLILFYLTIMFSTLSVTLSSPALLSSQESPKWPWMCSYEWRTFPAYLAVPSGCPRYLCWSNTPPCLLFHSFPLLQHRYSLR